MSMVEHYGECNEDHFAPPGKNAERGEVHYAILYPVENPPPVLTLHIQMMCNHTVFEGERYESIASLSIKNIKCGKMFTLRIY